MNLLFHALASTLLAIAPPSQVKAAKPARADAVAPAVARRLVISVGQTVPLQMSTKRPIRTVVNENDAVAQVHASVNDPTTVLVTGRAPGRTRITLTDADGKKAVCTIGGPAGRRD